MTNARHARRTGVALTLLGLVLAAPTASPGASADAPRPHPGAREPAAHGGSHGGHGGDGTDLPIFRSTGEIVDPFDDTLPWNPTHEFIFPSVFHAGRYLDHPLGEWYIYFAPHDAPGGINLMYSDNLDGPWTQYQGNPLITNHWDGIYDVSHVSSPDAVWNKSEHQMYLFFHGENTVTRFATTTDGLHFTYGDEAVTTSDVEEAQPGRDATETSYARVFPYPGKHKHTGRGKGYKWAMFFMTNYSDDIRRINVAYSHDLQSWDIADTPLVVPGDAEGGNVSAADLFRYHGKYYVTYHGSTGTILARPVDKALTTTGAPETIFVPQAAPPEDGRAASAQFVKDHGSLHMFYEYGPRSNTTVGHAIEDPTAERDPINPHPEDPVFEQCPGAGSDQFDGDTLDTGLWSSSVRTELSSDTVSGGELRMPTYAGNSTSAPLVLQPVPDGETWEVTTKLRLDPQVNYQQAGLILRRDDADSVRIDLSHAAGGQRIDFVYRHNGHDRIDPLTDYEVVPSTLGDTIWLRMTDHGAWVTASYSVDGETFQTVGRAAPSGDLAATAVGPFAYRGSAGVPEIEAAFDWVRFSPTEEELATCG